MVVSQRSRCDSTTGILDLVEFSGETICLGDRYTYDDSVDSLIGVGSFGIVFKGRDKKTNSGVAVKRISPIHIKQNELTIVKDLKNRYLVGVLDIYEVSDLISCVIMELCDGDLANHMKERSINGKLKPKNLRKLVNNIACGYKALFDKRIVHRDIKPQNILIKYEAGSDVFDTAKITDFGVARTLCVEDTPELCNVAGTLFYMAPEVGANLLKTCQYDSKVDMWSIGCLLFQCLTGEIPFDEGSLCKLFLYTACRNYEAYDPPEVPEEAHDGIVAIIHELLQIDSSRRCTPMQFYDTVISWNEGIIE